MLDVKANGKSCTTVFGNFTINQIAFTEESLSMVDLTFTAHCDAPTAPALEGTIHLNQLPMSYRQVSEAGDPLGGGVSTTHLYSTSIIYMYGMFSDYKLLKISGPGEEWSIAFSPPEGQQFTAGQTYQTRDTADSTHARLSVSGEVGTQKRSCAKSSGTLTIDSLENTPPSGRSTARISFVQRCAGATGSLRGTLEYAEPPIWELEE